MSGGFSLEGRGLLGRGGEQGEAEVEVPQHRVAVLPMLIGQVEGEQAVDLGVDQVGVFGQGEGLRDLEPPGGAQPTEIAKKFLKR